jgi:CRP/FNR family transcriptional regulator
MNAAPPRYADLYPALAHCSPLPDAPGSGIAPIQVPAGTELFSENAPCRGFPLVLEGEVKVSRHSGDGRSLELYRVVPGELCLVSSACLFRKAPLSAHGITTKPTTLLLIPPPIFNAWLESPSFRNDVLGLFAERMADLTGLIDAVAFRKLDQRLAAALLGRGRIWPLPTRRWLTNWALCAKSSRGCCAGLSGRAGLSSRASTFTSLTVRPCAPWPRPCRPDARAPGGCVTCVTDWSSLPAVQSILPFA